MNGKQILELLARLPARVWLQVILGVIGIAIIAVLGFAIVAGAAAVIALTLLGFKARQWIEGLFAGRSVSPPAHRHDGRVIDVQYEIVDRRKDDVGRR